MSRNRQSQASYRRDRQSDGQIDSFSALCIYYRDFDMDYEHPGSSGLSSSVSHNEVGDLAPDRYGCRSPISSSDCSGHSFHVQSSSPEPPTWMAVEVEAEVRFTLRL